MTEDQRGSLPQTRRGLTLLSQLCRDPAVGPKVPGRRRGERGFPAAPRQRPRESFFNASRGPMELAGPLGTPLGLAQWKRASSQGGDRRGGALPKRPFPLGAVLQGW